MKKVFFLFIIYLIAGLGSSFAVPAKPVPHTIIQPDGTEITIQLRGDEFFRYVVSEDDYLLAKNENGFFCYAELDADNVIIPTNIKANSISRRTKKEKDFLKTQAPTTGIKGSFAEFRTRNVQSRSVSQTQDTKYPLSGSPKSLIILVEYTDVKFVTSNVHQAFTDMLNKQGYSDNNGTGSARDYFRDNSMEKFTPEFVVAGPYTLPEAMAYYGTNQYSNDINASQMIIDACHLASPDIDFSEFDTDNNGIIDNVFVFYAGYNEAEYGPDESIWPHRSWIDERAYGEDAYIQGKRIYDYACTSELKGNSGSRMCGIGTFVHEFGHVLGLPDYYATTGASHHTLSYWSVMDAGPYLNEGRTPPAYSAYDRFYLGWLIPTELKGSQEVSLEPILQSNEAHIITKDGNHNLDGADPQPLQFFTLENRQNTGWDRYLPGHGLLVTRIYYNESDWSNNTVNRVTSRLGVKIMEADRIASGTTLSGDPFPGTSNVTYYIPELRDGTFIENKRIHIKEQDGIIYLEYIESDGIPIPLAFDALSVQEESFTANWQNVGGVNGYRVTIYSITDGSSDFSEDFDNGFNELFDWSATENNLTTDAALCGKTAPAVLLKNTGDYLQTKKYAAPVSELSFHAKTTSEIPVRFVLKGWNGTSWKQIEQFTITSENGQTINPILGSSPTYTRFRFELISGSPVAFDDIAVSLSKRVEYAKINQKEANEMFVLNNVFSLTLTNLMPDLDYYYAVRASRSVDGEEKVSPLSNRVQVRTPQATANKNKIRVLSAVNGTLNLYVSSEYLGTPVYIFSTTGLLIKHLPAVPNNYIEVNDMPRQQVYIVRVGKSYAKILML